MTQKKDSIANQDFVQRAISEFKVRGLPRAAGAASGVSGCSAPRALPLIFPLLMSLPACRRSSTRTL